MTNKELQEELKRYPDDLPMIIAIHKNGYEDYFYGELDALDHVGNDPNAGYLRLYAHDEQ